MHCKQDRTYQLHLDFQVRVHVCACACVCTCACVHVCVCVCACVFIANTKPQQSVEFWSNLLISTRRLPLWSSGQHPSDLDAVAVAGVLVNTLRISTRRLPLWSSGHAHTHALTFSLLRFSVCTCTHLCVCVCVHACACVCLCGCVWLVIVRQRC